MIKIWPSDQNSGGAPLKSYWSAGISNTIGPVMGIEALKYISFPAQILAKSSKMIPGQYLSKTNNNTPFIPKYTITFIFF